MADCLTACKWGANGPISHHPRCLNAVTRHERYNRSEKGRARYARYRQTPKGQRNDRRQHVVRNVARREALIQRNEEALA